MFYSGACLLFVRAYQLTQNDTFAKAAARCLDFIVPMMRGPTREGYIFLPSVKGDKEHRHGFRHSSSSFWSSSQSTSVKHFKGPYWLFVAMEYDRATLEGRYTTIANGIVRHIIDKITYDLTVYNINQGTEKVQRKAAQFI